MYIQSNPSFATILEPNELNVKNIGAGTESIHFALSDLPLKISFNVTVLSQLDSESPLRLILSYPLNANQLYLVFSPITNSVKLEIRTHNGYSRGEELLGYCLGQPIKFSIEISTVQSFNEYVTIIASNRTYSNSITLESEVTDLLRDQSRLIAAEVFGSNNFSGDSFAFGGSNFWTVVNYIEGGNSSLKQSNNTFSIVDGKYLQRYLRHDFTDSPLNLSQYDMLDFTFNGSGTGRSFRLWFNTDWENRYFLNFQDVLVGEQRIFVPLSSLTEFGNPTFDSIDRIGLEFPDSTGSWQFSDIIVGKANRLEGAVEVTFSDLMIDISPHSLAYAPLTNSNMSAILAIIAVILFIFLFLKDFIKASKRLFYWFRSFTKIRILVFALTFLLVFILYSIFFGLGDHAFDVFSQKLWSFDMVKYGLISIYQRPAVTSAAYTFAGLGSQHAIFPYAPLAGLYYFIIGQTYFLFSANPSVYDTFLTMTLKSFQVLTVLACGFLVYKIVRQYGVTWRWSYCAMLLFLFNPLVMYDAAVWGHQDALLMFFLLLSLWGFETNHPKTSYAALALAIMIKSTAFAPAAFMGFLILRKFGLRNLLEGITVGISSAFITTVPFILQGASPSTLINSTFYRVMQFGVAAYQYPRSAAVSPDGYNVWPLVTQSIGLSSRARMWYPDFLPIPHLGISYLLAGEIIFISIGLILSYLATRNGLKKPGSAAVLLGILMLASTIFLTKTTARYVFFGVAYLLVSHNLIGRRTKWLTIGILTFTSVFAMHGLLVAYTGSWIEIYPLMNSGIVVNGLILSLYLSDQVMTVMILLNLFAFFLVIGKIIYDLRKGSKKSLHMNTQRACEIRRI